MSILDKIEENADRSQNFQKNVDLGQNLQISRF